MSDKLNEQDPLPKAAGHNAAGEVTANAGTITDPRRTEEALHRFFDLVPDLACIASTNWRFLKINPVWQKALGYVEQEILAASFFDLIHPDDLDAMKETERQLACETLQFVNRYRCKDGSYKWLEWRMTPAVGEKLLIASARDITAHKRVEARIAEQIDELRRFNALMVGREMRIIELKHDVNELLREAGQPPRYPSAELDKPPSDEPE